MSRSPEDRAQEFAVKRHGGQRYDKDKPYAHHLEAVRDVLVRFGVTDEDLLAAAWLHDVVEDTSTSAQQVSERFGDRVGALVLAVTNEPGKNRRAGISRPTRRSRPRPARPRSSSPTASQTSSRAARLWGCTARSIQSSARRCTPRKRRRRCGPGWTGCWPEPR